MMGCAVNGLSKASDMGRAYELAQVGQHLEYPSATWDPHFVKDMKGVKSIQRYATRFVQSNCKRGE